MSKVIDLKDVQLSRLNPRFAKVDSLSSRLSSQILNDYQQYDEVQSIKDLLLREGDYSTLLDLVKSIKIADFDTTSDKPIFIRTLNEKFVVAEGNRRIMVMLMVLNSSYRDLIIENQVDLNEAEYLQSEEYKSQKANIKEIKNLFSGITYNPNWFIEEKTIDIFDEDKDNPGEISEEDDDKLWAMIYTKHISGDRPGLRRWPRGKYFVDIISFFPSDGSSDLDSDDLRKKSFSKLKRSFETLKEDLKQARFCLDVISSVEQDEVRAINIMRSKKISSLQFNFSVSYMRSAFKNIFGSTRKFKDYVEMSFDKMTNKFTYGGAISKSDLFNFIYKWWENKTVTTRGINKNEDVILYNNALTNLVMKYALDEDVVDMTAKNIMQANLEVMEDAKESETNSDVKEAINSLIHVKKNTTTASTIISKYPTLKDSSEKFNIFSYLKSQFEHNKAKYPGAEAITLRAFNEQVWIWLPYFNNYIFDKIMDTADNGLDFEKEEDRKKYLNDYVFADQQVTTIKGNIINAIQSKVDSESSDAGKIRVIRDIFEFILEASIPDADILSIYKKDGFGKILNGYIHSLHRKIGSTGFVEPVNEFNTWYTRMTSIINSFKQDFIDEVVKTTKEYITDGSV